MHAIIGKISASKNFVWINGITMGLRMLSWYLCAFKLPSFRMETLLKNTFVRTMSRQMSKILQASPSKFSQLSLVVTLNQFVNDYLRYLKLATADVSQDTCITIEIKVLIIEGM